MIAYFLPTKMGAFYDTLDGMLKDQGYTLPTHLRGLYGQVQHYMGENASNSVDKDAGTGNSFRLGYTIGDLYVSVASGRTNFTKSATTRAPSRPATSAFSMTWALSSPWWVTTATRSIARSR